MTFLKSMYFVEQKCKLYQNWKIPHSNLEKRTLCFSSYKNLKLKVKLWMNWSSQKKKRVFFAPLILPEGNIFIICFLTQCIAYWIHFQNNILLHIKKHYSMHFCCLFLKLSKAFSVYLKALISSFVDCYWVGFWVCAEISRM